MSRLTGSTQTEAISQVIRPVWFLHLDILNNATYLNSSDSAIKIGSQVYDSGVFGMPQLQEKESLAESRITFNLALDPSDSIIVALMSESNYRWRNLTATLYLLDDRNAFIGGACLTWGGKMTSVSTKQSDKAGVMSVIVQGWFSMLARPVGPKMTVPDQQHRYSSDSIFSLIPQIPGKLVVWMGTTNAVQGGDKSVPSLGDVTAPHVRFKR